MREAFDFTAPFGRLGLVAERLFLIRYVRAFLVRHDEEVQALAEFAD